MAMILWLFVTSLLCVCERVCLLMEDYAPCLARYCFAFLWDIFPDRRVRCFWLVQVAVQVTSHSRSHTTNSNVTVHSKYEKSKQTRTSHTILPTVRSSYSARARMCVFVCLRISSTQEHCIRVIWTHEVKHVHDRTDLSQHKNEASETTEHSKTTHTFRLCVCVLCNRETLQIYYTWVNKSKRKRG